MAPQPKSRSYYDILGVARDASSDEIHRAYRKLARQYHPDVNSSAEARSRFAELSDAYEVLHDSDQRARYDRRTGVVGRGSAPIERSSAPTFVRDRLSRDVPRFLGDEPEAPPAREAADRWRPRVVLWDRPRPARPRFELTRRPWPDVRWLR
jgi:curved DNA-binding protein CbpA